MMNLKSCSRNRAVQTGRGCRVAVVVLLLVLAAPLYAEGRYLAPGHPDGVALLPPPPAAGSDEESADLASARAIFNGRTPVAEARALKDQSLAFSLFAPAVGPVFQLEKLPKTEALLKKVRSDISNAIDTPKDHWKRRRPYQLDEHLALGKPEPSSGYPSGHSVRGTVYSMVLAEVFPEKKAAILAVGRDIGWDRAVIGKHFPTDIFAGRVLGQAIMRELLANSEFQHDLAAAKAEAAQAKSEPVPAEAAAGVR